MKEYVLFLMMAVSLAACTKVEEAPVAPPVVAKAPDPKPTPEEAIIALFRAHPHAKKICYEPEFNGYYFQYPDAVDGVEDNMRHGTTLVQDIIFLQSSNKTWFINQIEESRYVPVWPDLTDLICKIQ